MKKVIEHKQLILDTVKKINDINNENDFAYSDEVRNLTTDVCNLLLYELYKATDDEDFTCEICF